MNKVEMDKNQVMTDDGRYDDINWLNKQAEISMMESSVERGTEIG